MKKELEVRTQRAKQANRFLNCQFMTRESLMFLVRPIYLGFDYGRGRDYITKVTGELLPDGKIRIRGIERLESGADT
jgi:hypothetical protein